MTPYSYLAYLLICLPLNLTVACVGWSLGFNLRAHLFGQAVVVLLIHFIIAWAVAITMLLS